jgi:TctA family transporter
MVSAIKSRWDYLAFFNRPIAIGLMIATLLIIAIGLRIQLRNRQHSAQKPLSDDD